MMSAPAPPAALRRLLFAYPAADLAAAGSGDLVIGRVLEDGDTADLRWLVARFGEARLGHWLAVRGGRQLSRRSRAFWQVVLGRPAGPPNPVAEALWPL